MSPDRIDFFGIEYDFLSKIRDLDAVRKGQSPDAKQYRGFLQDDVHRDFAEQDLPFGFEGIVLGAEFFAPLGEAFEHSVNFFEAAADGF